MMDRRCLIALLGGGSFAWPLELRAQQRGRTYSLGPLFRLSRDESHLDPTFDTLLDELRRHGFVEGQNLTIDPRGYGLRADQFPDAARELAKAPVDVILAFLGNPAIRAAQQATATIPILGVTEDMVGSGLVSSMAHPGGNLTGVSLLSPELDGKRQELLIELIPGVRHIAVLADANQTPPRLLQALEETAREHGVELSIQQIAKPEEIIGAVDAAKAAGAAALNVLASPLTYLQRQEIIERTTALRLPTMYSLPESAADGGLVGYGADTVQLYRDVVSRQLIKLLQGVKPADIPIEQPTRFELVINLRTAKALDLSIPPNLLDLADEVIE